MLLVASPTPRAIVERPSTYPRNDTIPTLIFGESSMYLDGLDLKVEADLQEPSQMRWLPHYMVLWHICHKCNEPARVWS